MYRIKHHHIDIPTNVNTDLKFIVIHFYDTILPCKYLGNKSKLKKKQKVEYKLLKQIPRTQICTRSTVIPELTLTLILLHDKVT